VNKKTILLFSILSLVLLLVSVGAISYNEAYAQLGPKLPQIFPDAPNLTGTDDGTSKITLTWNVPYSPTGEPVTHYTLHIKSSSGAVSEHTTTSTSMTYRGFPVGYDYEFVVTASTISGTSHYSNPIHIRSLAPMVEDFKGTIQPNGDILLTWQPDSRVHWYYVQYTYIDPVTLKEREYNATFAYKYYGAQYTITNVKDVKYTVKIEVTYDEKFEWGHTNTIIVNEQFKIIENHPYRLYTIAQDKMCKFQWTSGSLDSQDMRNAKYDCTKDSGFDLVSFKKIHLKLSPYSISTPAFGKTCFLTSEGSLTEYIERNASWNCGTANTRIPIYVIKEDIKNGENQGYQMYKMGVNKNNEDVKCWLQFNGGKVDEFGERNAKWDCGFKPGHGYGDTVYFVKE